jgi:membrane protein
MASAPRKALNLLKNTVGDFLEDQCPRMAASLSYYTVFSLPPLLVLLLLIAGAFLDPRQVQEALTAQMGSLIGRDGVRQVTDIIANAKQPGGGSVLATIFGMAALIFGATGAFLELQSALNRAWEVKPDPKKGGIRNFLVKRVFSFGMIVVIAFLLLVSLAVSAALAAFGDMLGRMAPGNVSAVLLQALNLVVSFAAITLLFAAMFKVLPDAVVAWRDVLVGGAATTFLFVLGKFLIGFYIGNSNPTSAYGATGSLAVLFLWVYYSAMILLLGAEFTQAWAISQGRGIEPEEGAVRFVEEQHAVRSEAEQRQLDRQERAEIEADSGEEQEALHERRDPDKTDDGGGVAADDARADRGRARAPARRRNR